MLAFHTRKAEKTRQRLSQLRARDDYDAKLWRLAASKQLMLRADEAALIEDLCRDFRRENPGLLLVALPERQPAQGDSETLVMRAPAMVELRVLSAELSLRHWLGPYDVLVPRTQEKVVGEFGPGSWWTPTGMDCALRVAVDRGELCEDAWKELYAEYSPADGLWHCSEAAYL